MSVICLIISMPTYIHKYVYLSIFGTGLISKRLHKWFVHIFHICTHRTLTYGSHSWNNVSYSTAILLALQYMMQSILQAVIVARIQQNHSFLEQQKLCENKSSPQFPQTWELCFKSISPYITWNMYNNQCQS